MQIFRQMLLLTMYLALILYHLNKTYDEDHP